ncbi:hypothetical protein K493DRAFT_229284 [Basidiobolus meristosporus CBS 931.73]|uniref:Uncharacterized protein n=1 Tax=Basidiobolus meristosporus CBS 931.73 TaxID=1314790 RepID=A0A1Y1XZM7_9FUNG|nr:hypothetical protein K493DRAFT_229284 [Basidiobolus meristosporus CBS 931.73]|eukprot:ORX90936.1 hypothetical protein K493DRAFT_229284 [Basidiobolus meristosporus CBS 931.73]
MDMNWCIICDKHVDLDDSLYCSEMCRLEDAKSVAVSRNVPQLTHDTRKIAKIASKPILVNVTTYPSPPMTPVLSPIRASKTSPQVPPVLHPFPLYKGTSSSDQAFYRSPTSPDCNPIYPILTSRFG